MPQVAMMSGPAVLDNLSPWAVLDDARETARFTTTATISATLGSDAASESTCFLRIAGMHCAACATVVEAALRRVDGVREVRVSVAAQTARVRWATTLARPSAFADAVQRAGYDAVPDTTSGARQLRRREARDALWRLFVAGFCAMQVMMLATPAYLAGPAGLAPDLKRLLDASAWLLTLPVMLFAARPFLAGAWRALRQRRLGMDVPVALGIVVAFVASGAAAFDPAGPFGAEVYFDSLTMFVSFLLAGRWLEMRVRHRAAESLEASIGRLPDTALRESQDGSRIEPVSVLRLRVGDRLRVPLGQAFCADGVVVQGATRADESLLTGEALPVEKAEGDAVVAGSLNLGAPVVMRVERVGADTRYEAMVAMVRDAATCRPALLRSADRWATPFLWAVLLLAALAAAAWSVIDPARAAWVAVSVLIVTCPCALSLAAPSAWVAASAAMARHGVLLRRVEAIEGLATMEVLFVDKTGTLTEPQPAEMPIVRTDAGRAFGDEAGLRAIAASLASWSTHPLSKALATAGAAPPWAWAGLHEAAGSGIVGQAPDSVRWSLGRAATGPPSTGQADDAAAQTWLCRNGIALAGFAFTETLRPQAAAAVQALQRDGVEVVLLSGDAPGRVAHVAGLLGLRTAHAGMTPQAKLDVLRAAQSSGAKVAMLGDGINDAPVLAQADVSLAMAAGAQIARAEADGVLVSNRLDDVVRARALAKKTLRVVRQNLVWAAIYNAACVPLALLGALPAWAAGLGMATSSLVVVLNSLRLAR